MPHQLQMEAPWNVYSGEKGGEFVPKKSEITYVEPGSLAQEAGIEAGDFLLYINGNDVRDVLEYRYLMSEYEVELTIKKKSGEIEEIIIENDYEDIGIEFSSGLIDDAKSCTNKCIFCFIDQLPKGMRETVYFKDDDTRLSFLQGNYVTLTNMKEEELDRLISMRVSPINISVHTTNPKLREKMLNNRFAGRIYDIMKKFSQNSIHMNCQVVLCPGINDEKELEKTVLDIRKLHPFIDSLAIVPVGLTAHREGLCTLKEFDSAGAKRVIEQVKAWQDRFLDEIGTRLVYLSDEFYLMADVPMPRPREYEGFPQLENGVGLISGMEEEFSSALEMVKTKERKRRIAIATGEIAYPFINELCLRLMEKAPGLEVSVYAIKNEFFGGGVNVAGLVTGGDIINQLKGRLDTRELLIPEVMLRDGEDIFLDDVTVVQLEEELGVTVTAVSNDGYEFLEKVLGEELEF